MPTPQTEDAVAAQDLQGRIGRRIFSPILRRRQAVVRGGEAFRTIEYDPTSEVSTEGQSSNAKPPLRLITFILIVILPFFASLFYFAVLASDQYTAEARFAVRSVADDGTGDKGDNGVLNMQNATQDAYVVTSFIHSTEVLNRLGAQMDYRAMFARHDADFFSRFDLNTSNEEFLKYWSNQVTAYIDGPSGIITLKVRTFRPEDSVKLASAIISQSESLINELSLRARHDIVASVQADVQKSAKTYGDTLAALNQFQHDSGLLSPDTQAQETGKLLTGLVSAKLEAESRLFVLKQSSADNSPAYRQLTATQESLDSQIDKLRGQLTGPENASIAKSLLHFSQLETDRLVAEQLYEASRRNYDAAVAEALRKTLYVSVFVPPALPDEALYPRRLATPLIILLGLTVLWATLSLAWASVQDHRL